jgi:DUF4097 and DUF4098 domain-containing protein YvlB
LIPQGAQAKKDRFDLDEVYSLDPDGIIYLTTDDADVEIVGSNRRDVHLEIHYECKRSGLFWESKGEAFDVEVRTENGNLYIKEIEDDRSHVGIMMQSHELRHTVLLEVPEGASLKIRGDDDDYDIDNIQGSISMDFEDGDAVLDKCLGGEYELEIEDGSIEMKGGKGSLSAYLEDGDIIVWDGAFEEIDAEVEDGDIEISTSLEDDGTYRLECEDGDIELVVLKGGGEFRITHEDGRVRASGAYEEEEDEEHYSVFILPGGDAHVRIRTEDGRVRLSTD